MPMDRPVVGTAVEESMTIAVTIWPNTGIGRVGMHPPDRLIKQPVAGMEISLKEYRRNAEVYCRTAWTGAPWTDSRTKQAVRLARKE